MQSWLLDHPLLLAAGLAVTALALGDQRCSEGALDGLTAAVLSDGEQDRHHAGVERTGLVHRWSAVLTSDGPVRPFRHWRPTTVVTPVRCTGASQERRVSAGPTVTGPEALVPAVADDRPAAVLVVDLAARRVVHANDLARQLAPGTALPTPVDAWSDAAELRDPAGEVLSETVHPLSLTAQGVPVPGQVVTARRSSDVSGTRQPLFAVGLPLDDAPGLAEHALVIMVPLQHGSAGAADAPGGSVAAAVRVREQAVLATGTSFTIADARAADQPLVWVNPAFSAVTGYSVAESVGRNCRFLQGPGTDPAAVATLRRAIDAGEEAVVTLLNTRKDGSTFWNQVALSPVRDGQGTVTHVVGVQNDVTERVQAERAREVALAAERRARAEAETARADAERAGARAALLAEGSQLLSGTLDADEALDLLLDLLVPALGDWAAVAVVGEGGALVGPSLVRHRGGHHDPLAEYADLVPASLAQDSVLAALVRGAAGRITGEVPGQDGQLRPEVVAGLGAASVLLVPLVAWQKVLGTVTLVRGPQRAAFTPEDLATAADLGRRAGLVVDNARLYTGQESLALSLQQALLPRLPAVSGLALAAQYLPAARGVQVGGDWWDVFTLPDGATAVAVGDVMGHDVAAAAAMGQLRSVLRACAWDGDDPARVLGRTDQLVQGFEMAQLATCLYARLTTPPAGPACLEWACAGHLPPVLLPAGGRPRLLTGPVGVPLGVPVDETRTTTEVVLGPGDTLLLYTDGLVETRNGDIDTDLQRLLAAVGAHDPAAGPQALVDALADPGARRDDDVALLAIQLLPAPSHETARGPDVPVPDARVVTAAAPAAQRRPAPPLVGAGPVHGPALLALPADPTATRAGRRFVVERCRRHRLPDAVTDDVALVASELITNAVLHGRSTVTVAVHLDTAGAGAGALRSAVLRLEVSDDNARAPQRQDTDPAALDGRGLHIIDALTDRWGVQPRAVGKTVWCEVRTWRR